MPTVSYTTSRDTIPRLPGIGPRGIALGGCALRLRARFRKLVLA